MTCVNFKKSQDIFPRASVCEDHSVSGPEAVRVYEFLALQLLSEGGDELMSTSGDSS